MTAEKENVFNISAPTNTFFRGVSAELIRVPFDTNPSTVKEIDLKKESKLHRNLGLALSGPAIAGTILSTSKILQEFATVALENGTWNPEKSVSVGINLTILLTSLLLAKFMGSNLAEAEIMDKAATIVGKSEKGNYWLSISNQPMRLIQTRLQ